MRKEGADSQEDTVECELERRTDPFQQKQITGIGFRCLRNMPARSYAQTVWTSSSAGLVVLTILKDTRYYDYWRGSEPGGTSLLPWIVRL